MNWLKKYFIPHKHNNFKPHLLRREATVFILFFIIIVELGLLTQVFIVFDKTNFLASVLPGVLTSLTNKERAENNAGPLVENDLLTKAAQLKANDMATRGYFAHTSPDGKTPWYWFDQVGYHYSSAGENLAVNFFESSDVAQAWMDSPTHRANIVKKNYQEIGIGVATGLYEGKNTVFVAQLFGTPLATPTITTQPLANKNIENTIPVVKPKNTQPKIVPPVNPNNQGLLANNPTIPNQVLGEAVTPSIVSNKSLESWSSVKSFVEKALVSPRDYVNYIYGLIALMVVVTTGLVMFIKSEIRHPLIVTRGLVVVGVIVLILYANTILLKRDTKVPTDELSATVIAY